MRTMFPELETHLPVLRCRLRPAHRRANAGSVNQYPPSMTTTLWHKPPVLVGEKYPMQVALHANDEHIRSGFVNLTCTLASGATVPIYSTPTSAGEPIGEEGLAIPDMVPNQVALVSVWATVGESGTARLKVDVSYWNQRRCVPHGSCAQSGADE